METTGFVCAVCGVAHEGLPTDIGYRLPDAVVAIPQPDRAARAEWNSDVCKMGDRFFIRGVLRVPLLGRNDDFGWGVWAEVAPEAFQRYLELHEKDGSNEPLKTGTLANDISFYEDAASERILIQFGPSGDRPDFLTDPKSTSSLARDQAEGIDEARYHQLLVTEGLI